MGLATQTKEIGGRVFSVTQLPAMRALKTLNRLGRALGPAIGKLFGGAVTGQIYPSIGAMEAAHLGDALAILFERLTDAELEGLVNTFLETALVDNRPLMPEFNLTMQGRVSEVLLLLKFAIEVNYGDFFGALRGLAPAPVAQANGSTSTTT